MAVGNGMSQIVVFGNDHLLLRSTWVLQTVCSLLSAHIAQTVTNCFHYPTLGRQGNTGGPALTNEN